MHQIQRQVVFLKKIYKDLIQTFIQESVPIIWGGDFNLPMSIEDTDRASFNLKKKSIASLKNIMESEHLIDIYGD